MIAGTLQQIQANADPATSALEGAESVLLVGKLLASLPSRDASVLRMLYGIGYEFPYSVALTANALSISQATVRRIHKAALEHLRALPREEKAHG